MYLNGHLLARDLTYQVQLAVADRDYRDGAKSPVYDAYLDYRAHRDLQVRAGQFFVPFDRLRTIREYALHLAADAVFKWEGLAIQGEYLWKRSATDVIVSTNSDGSTKKEPTRSAYGWVAQASYVFETPYEVVARASRMTAISGTDPGFVADLHAHGQEFAFGVNRYLNGHRFKLQATWIARTPRDANFTKAEHTAYVLVDATM